MTDNRIKVLTSHAAHARFLSRVSEEPMGCVPRRAHIPSPYAYAPDHTVWNLDGQPIIIIETAHRRFEVFAVDPAEVQPVEVS